jgi:hypothetical protein
MSNKYHSNLNLPFTFNPIETVKDSPHFIEDRIRYARMIETNPDLIKWLRSLGLYIQDTRCFHSLPNQTYNKHIDNNQRNVNSQVVNKPYTVKLNFVFNSLGTIMRWYDLLPGHSGILYKNVQGEDVMGFTDDSVTEIYRSEVNTHCIINAGTIHDLSNNDNNNTNRICYSSILEDFRSHNLTWDKAVEIFKPYIY